MEQGLSFRPAGFVPPPAPILPSGIKGIIPFLTDNYYLHKEELFLSPKGTNRTTGVKMVFHGGEKGFSQG
jgi:hypothetical protein